MSEKPIILFKYGGNAMTDNNIKKGLLKNIIALKQKGINVAIAHGGGPFIKEILKEVNIQSEFVDGQRKTSTAAFKYIEMALKGQVNSDLVNTLNTLGGKAVGLSGKDGQIVIAAKKQHKTIINNKEEIVDLGQVGVVDKVDRTLLDILFENNYIPVIACIAADEDGNSYNINGDTFAGTLAGALKADQFVVLTDVDGLLMDKDDPASIIASLNFEASEKLINEGIIQGGMVPKINACKDAIKRGAKAAKIINGTKPDQINSIDENKFGTLIIK